LLAGSQIDSVDTDANTLDPSTATANTLSLIRSEYSVQQQDGTHIHTKDVFVDNGERSLKKAWRIALGTTSGDSWIEQSVHDRLRTRII
jgi:hypothetical protein